MLFLSILAGIALAYPQIAAQANETNALPPIAYAARVIGDTARSRLIVDFDKKVSHEAYLLDNPKRIVVDLPETVFSLDGELERLPKSLVSNLRYGLIAPGKSRLVLELADAVTIENHLVRELTAEGRHRLIVDMVKATDKQFAAMVRRSDEVSSGDNQARNQNQGPIIVVIDPGHGGIDGGATGANKTVEKDITLNFAKKLRARFADDEAFKILLTREEDTFMGLRDRLAFAREKKADLLISVHADSLKQKFIRGATVYTLSAQGSDELSIVLARKQNRADLIAGLELPTVESDVSDIFIDMTRQETKVFSKQFADIVVKKMRNKIKLINNPHRSADFFVLKAPEVPSILLELGYLSNKEDESLMTSPKWQGLAVKKTADAIREFFKPRLAQ